MSAMTDDEFEETAYSVPSEPVRDIFWQDLLCERCDLTEVVFCDPKFYHSKGGRP